MKWKNRALLAIILFIAVGNMSACSVKNYKIKKELAELEKQLEAAEQLYYGAETHEEKEAVREEHNIIAVKYNRMVYHLDKNERNKYYGAWIIPAM